jgi:hypothetical protein
MLKFKLGALIGFAAGWMVGTGRAAKLWDEFQNSAVSRKDTGPTAATEHLAEGRIHGSRVAAG